ncbi:hypothetical protein [Desulfofustis limnaeus]|uniref:hypothetical protein n=1 Tax=Desulfofustis limnaeus TaxID=2740163 RepID=UPI0024E00C7E|nr:hypothetical protein [Desulfofustis limnaeus]MDX9894116.1 hypothetical protein [Desulfofustis sp.]
MPAALKRQNQRQAAVEAVKRVPGAPNRPKHRRQAAAEAARRVPGVPNRPRHPPPGVAEAGAKTAPGALTNNPPSNQPNKNPRRAAEAVDQPCGRTSPGVSLPRVVGAATPVTPISIGR